MKKFIFLMFIRTKQGQEFNIGKKEIVAKDYDLASSIFNKLDLPFHHFTTVKSFKLINNN
jgi:hypothetical protein